MKSEDDSFIGSTLSGIGWSLDGRCVGFRGFHHVIAWRMTTTSKQPKDFLNGCRRLSVDLYHHKLKVDKVTNSLEGS
ncbi:hypothetical protein ACI65C_010449 [Semiaphis heraclei]